MDSGKYLSLCCFRLLCKIFALLYQTFLTILRELSFSQKVRETSILDLGIFTYHFQGATLTPAFNAYGAYSTTAAAPSEGLSSPAFAASYGTHYTDTLIVAFVADLMLQVSSYFSWDYSL